MSRRSASSQPTSVEPRWPAGLAVFAVGGLNLALPDSLSLGPRWLLLLVVAALLVPTELARRRGWHAANQFAGYMLDSVVTVAMVWALAALIAALPRRAESPLALLRSAAVLWVTNVLVFASWYWRLDAGGPHKRDLRAAHTEGAFLFPQMQMMLSGAAGERTWRPGFVDYLFLAFNTSTALSPTDTPVLSRWAKIMVMLQAIISLTTVVILVARAVNIL